MPVIAAVNGPAIGAGLDIACMCDIRLASERARFSEAFVRLGLISGIGGAWFLPRAVGPSRAAELSFTARVFDAAQALEYGLVSEVVAPDQLMPRAHELAGEIARHSGMALRFCKRLLRKRDGLDLRASLDLTAALQAIAHQTPEHHAAVECFLAARERG
ncbi:enoyl-CoA hydratase-related protein [Pseudoroseomonas wenyumeiae]